MSSCYRWRQSRKCHKADYSSHLGRAGNSSARGFNQLLRCQGAIRAGQNVQVLPFHVSIHAPSLPRGDAADDAEAVAIMPFQSTHPVSGRRCIRPSLASACRWLFQSTPPVSGRRCSSPVTTGSIRTKSPHCANLFIPEQKTSYAPSPPSGKPHQIRQKRGARTYRGKHVHLGFAQAHRMSGASKSVARKQPCSRTS